jgi:hypothetical protein
MSYFPIEKPGKSISFNSSRNMSEHGGHNEGKGGKEEKRHGWSSEVSPKPEGSDRSKYFDSLSNIKGKAMGISKNRSSGVVKAWSFNRVRSDSKSPELNKYGDSLSHLKGSINKKD